MTKIMKDAAFFLINGVRSLIYLCCLVFKIKNNYIFVNYFDGRVYGDHPKYILKEFWKQDVPAKVIWVNYGNDDIEGITNVLPFSLKAIYYQAVSKIWISTVRMPYYSWKRKGQYYIQTWYAQSHLKSRE